MTHIALHVSHLVDDENVRTQIDPELWYEEALQTIARGEPGGGGFLMYTSTYMAGQVGYVFGYDAETNKPQTELSEFPLLTFDDNGRGLSTIL